MTRIEIRKNGIKVTRGPLGTAYACPHCKHVESFRSGVRGVGRGHGLRQGGACWSRMVAHIRREHPEAKKN